MQQLSLFDNKIFKVASDLLESLNENLKEDEKFKPQYTFLHNGITVLIAANRNKKILFNALDGIGEVPKGCSANWRTFEHINHELNIKINK